MAKVTMTVVEEVVIEYIVHYDEDTLKDRGLSIRQYLSSKDNDAWSAMSTDVIIGDVQHNQILDYLNTDLTTMDLGD